MIVARGMGRGGRGALVAFGLGNSLDNVSPPEVGVPTGGGTSRRRRTAPQSERIINLNLARADDEVVLAVIVAAVTQGMLEWPDR